MAMKSESWLDYATASNFPCLTGGNVVLYFESHEVFISGRSVHLSRAHFRMLAVLLSEFCKTVSYYRILGTEPRPLTRAEQNLLKVQMFHLRKILRRREAHLEVRNVYGQGYQARPLRPGLASSPRDELRKTTDIRHAGELVDER
jgi:DNA-binding response OmpR family regulator